MDPVLILKIVLVLFTLPLAFFLIKDVFGPNKEPFNTMEVVKSGIIGFFTDFFDTLGIGSFAPTTTAIKATKLLPDIKIPGTLNVGHAIPVALEAFLFFDKVAVDPMTLILMIAAAIVGAVVGAGFISKMDAQKIRIIMGIALLATALLMVLRMTGVFAQSEEAAAAAATGLTGAKLIIGIVCNFVLGALMTAGVGLYAPCLALVYFLGMNVSVAFPIMMGSCAFLMQPAGIKFIKENAYARNPSFIINIFGCIGVYVAVKFFQSLNIETLKWVVVGVILVTAVIMLRAALVGKKDDSTAKEA